MGSTRARCGRRAWTLTMLIAIALPLVATAGEPSSDSSERTPANAERLEWWRAARFRHVHPLGSGEHQGNRDWLVARSAGAGSRNTTASTSSSIRRSSTPAMGRSPSRPG